MGIDLIPMPFFVDGETYLEGKDCTPETFFQRMKAGAEISTSQPAPEEITSLWDTLLKTHTRCSTSPCPRAERLLPHRQSPGPGVRRPGAGGG